MKAICKYIEFKLFIVLIFLILMLKSPFQGRSIKCMVWHGMAWHGMAWYGMVWYGMVWYVCMYVH